MRRLRTLNRALVVFGLALVMAGTAAAWQDPTPTPTPTPTAAAEDQEQQGQEEKCPPEGLKDVQVTKVRLVPPFDEKTEKATPRPASGKEKKNLPVVELRDTIAVTIQGLDVLLAQERCLQENGEERSIVLYLDRRPLPDVVAQPPSDPSQNVLMFPLSRTEDSRDVWTYLLGRPRLRDREVEVSIGIDDQFAVKSNALVYLRVIPRGWFSFWVLIFGIFAVGFFLLARRSDLLRDPVTAPAGARPPYSLARWQAAWWFFLILASYLLIGMVTGDFSTSMTGTVLVLLGISAGTAAGSAFIDASKTNRTSQAQDVARAQVLWKQIEDLDAKNATLEAEVRTSGDQAKAQKLADNEALRKEKLSIYSKLTNQSESFLLDVLSDSNGVNFHRFQALAWTVVLGFIFVGHVFRDLAMPQFSETLLGLMGISSGTYLSLKIPENPSPDPAQPNPPAPPE
ncbi:MAG TPA: hypothetical protein VN493_18285 [Thermoanaerobaculia bacterium]|nr:hypothetical protein [Thermoanaerobaculia bacterium]